MADNSQIVKKDMKFTLSVYSFYLAQQRKLCFITTYTYSRLLLYQRNVGALNTKGELAVSAWATASQKVQINNIDI